MKHRWGDRVVITAKKTERDCANCGLVKVTRHETEGGRDLHWIEFWRGLDRIECTATPLCEAVKADA